MEKRINTNMALDFLLQDIVNNVMGCRPVSSRLITIRLKAVPFNITIVQVYAPTSDYDDNEIEEFYDQLQNVIDKTPKEDILVVQGYWNAKVGKGACGNRQGICGPFCNDDTNERGLRLLEFATFNDLVFANIFGHHKASSRHTWNSPNGQHHSQIDYILVRKDLKDRVTNEEVHAKIQQAIGPHEDLVTIVKRRKLQWYGHVSRSPGLAKTILQGTVKEEGRQGRHRKGWEDNIREWTGLEFCRSQRAVENREKWRKLVAKSSVVPQRSS